MEKVQERQFVEVGERLKALRLAMGEPNQKAWAARHHFNATQYNNWENGVRRIPVDSAEALCAAYGISLDFIYRGRREGLPETLSKVL